MSRNVVKASEQQISVAKELLEKGHTISAAARHAGLSRPTIISYQKKGILPFSDRQKFFDAPKEPDLPVKIVSDVPASPVLLENRESEIGKLRTELERVAYSNMLDFAEWDGTTVVLKDSADLPRELGAVIKSVSMTRDGVKIQLHDKLVAITKLLQLFGVTTIEDAPGENPRVTNNFYLLMNRVVEQTGQAVIPEAETAD